TPLLQIALEHRSDQSRITLRSLFEDAGPHDLLALVALARVGVAAVDQDPGRQAGVLELSGGLGDELPIVVRALASAAQEQMARWITARRDDGCPAVLVDPQKAMGCERSSKRIDRGLDPSLGRVLVTHRHAQPARHLPVRLRLDGAGPD